MIHESTSLTPLGTGGSAPDRRVLDIAVGILVGLQRCSVDSAFRQVVDAAHRHDIPVFTLASALISLAGAEHEAQQAADRAAQQEWRHLFAPAHIGPPA
jgi:hypothetical protein